MDTSITTEPAGKRARNGSDRKCPGLYISITTTGVATFSFKFTDPETGKQCTGWLGVYNPETSTVEDARSRVYGLRGKGAAALAETFRDRKLLQAKRGKTVNEIIEERIDCVKTSVRKPDGEMRPRIETWENVASHLRRFLSPRLGKKIASEVTKHDIATLSNDIVAGRHGGKPSVANAHHMRRAVRQPPASTCRSSTRSIRARGCCPRMRSGPSGTASTGTICRGIAGPASRSSSSWSPCCDRASCSARIAARCSISTASIHASTSRSSG